MPILIEGATFTDFNGDVLSYYQSNAGDKLTAVVSVRSAIRMSSIGNSLVFDYTLNTVSSTTISWLEEGFRVGDWVLIVHYNSSASVIDSWYTQVNLVDDTTCDFDTLNNLTLNTANGESIIFLVVTGNGILEARSRDTLDVLLNHSVNNNTAAPESLIDGEVTRSVFPGVGVMAVSDIINGDLVGNQSGQFLVSSSIKRNATPADGWLRHEITLEFTNSGAYNQAWFSSSNCLKMFVKLLWASVTSEPFARTEAVYSFDSNTGWFNQPHNTSVADSSLVSGVAEDISFCTPTTGLSVTVDGPTTDLGFGFMYIPIDTSYYKNQIYAQQDLTMLRPTTQLATGIFGSETNPSGAAYGVNITNITTLGSETTIDFDFGGNTEFNDFMESRNQDDRRLVIWIKCGNANLLVFDGQLTCEPVTFATLPMVQNYGYIDHSQNVTSAVGDSEGFIADTEDDVAFVGSFLLEKEELFDSFSVKIEAFNDITLQDFTLQQAIFSFSGVQISNDGRYLLAEQSTSITTLPTTSEKRFIILELDPSLDIGTQYGVKIYAPWLLNWKYWIAKTNANVDFYPNQTENWQPYDGGVTDWTIRTELILQQGILGYHHANRIRVRDYDAESFIVSNIEMIRELDGSIVTSIPAGELMRIRSTHTKNGGDWSPSATWAMHTVEPFESSPRSICSSVVPFDNNSFNPLVPENGALIVISYPSLNVAVVECLFDSSKIDLSNGVSVTAKIKDPRNGTDPDLPVNYQERIKKKYEAVKLPESFEEQDRGLEKCCDKVRVLASPDAETWKNDVTSAWIKLANASDTFTFELRKNGVVTATYTPTSNQFVNQTNAYYTTILWKEVLSQEGIGCYQIVIVWNIGGISSETIWRNTTYNLEEYTIQRARTTARIRSIFNLDQMIEGIDFTDSNVEDSIRFCGQIRKDQPNTKYKNVTYNNRRIEPVISEKSQTYIIETDGYTDPMLKLLEDLFLLSSNEMFISDYNAHTNDYSILDKEVTMLEDESPEREPSDRFARQEVLTCVVGNRYRNERTHY